MNEEIIEFLQHSNWIEKELSSQALDDAVLAWKFAYKNKNKINLNYVLKIHKILMKNLRSDIAGKIRNCDVYIGGHRKIFVSESLIKEELRDVLATMNVPRFIPKKEEEFTKHCHVMFENIHPFIDGNGRTGRILWQIHRINLKIPIKIIKESEKYKYYEWFNL